MCPARATSASPSRDRRSRGQEVVVGNDRLSISWPTLDESRELPEQRAAKPLQMHTGPRASSVDNTDQRGAGRVPVLSMPTCPRGHRWRKMRLRRDVECHQRGGLEWRLIGPWIEALFRHLTDSVQLRRIIQNLALARAQANDGARTKASPSAATPVRPAISGWVQIDSAPAATSNPAFAARPFRAKQVSSRPFAGVSTARVVRLVQATFPSTVVRQSESSYLRVNGPPMRAGRPATNWTKASRSYHTESSSMSKSSASEARTDAVSSVASAESNHTVMVRSTAARSEARILETVRAQSGKRR